MSTKNLAKLTRLFILQEASRLDEALFEWRCICSERYGDLPYGSNVVLAGGVETRAEQTLRHDAVVGECGRRLTAAIPTVVSHVPSDAVRAEVV